MVRRLCRVQFSIAGDAPASAARDGPHSRPRRERRRSCPTPRSKQRARSTTDDFSASAPIALTANRLRAKQLRKIILLLYGGRLDLRRVDEDKLERLTRADPLTELALHCLLGLSR